MKGNMFEEQNVKNRIEKIFIYQRDIFRIQSGKTPIGLHGEGGKSNFSEEGP